MAILIVDDESSTRAALRDLLTQLGHKTILEAKNGEEGLKLAVAEKNRLRLMIADWEMPYLDGIGMLERIAEIPELDLVPFLLITSDLPRSKLAELQARTTRLDSFLLKPFRMNALEKAMTSAQSHRAALRRQIIALAPSGNLPPPLQIALAQTKIQTSWDVPLTPPAIARTLAELQQAVQTYVRTLGAIVVDPDPAGLSAAEARTLSEWLTSFSRTPLGIATPIICASRDPQAILPLRLVCQAFISEPAQWPEFWTNLRRKSECALDLELLFQELKVELQQKREPSARGEVRKLCERILAIDASSGEAHATLGDLLETQTHHAEAIHHYWSALATNPCQPKPYIRLLAAIPAGTPALGEAASQASAHCPQNPDVLLAAARAWINIGESSKAQELARRILVLNPQHTGAQALLNLVS